MAALRSTERQHALEVRCSRSAPAVPVAGSGTWSGCRSAGAGCPASALAGNCPPGRVDVEEPERIAEARQHPVKYSGALPHRPRRRPLRRASSGSGTTRSGRPRAGCRGRRTLGQAPYGAIERERSGSSSSMDMPCAFGQASCWLSAEAVGGSVVVSSTSSSTTMPSARFSAVSTEVGEPTLALRRTRRSTTTSMSWFSLLSSGRSVSE